jgi:hypothetical protein
MNCARLDVDSRDIYTPEKKSCSPHFNYIITIKTYLKKVMTYSESACSFLSPWYYILLCTYVLQNKSSAMKAPSSPDSHRRVGVSGFAVPWGAVPRNPRTHLTILFCVFLSTLVFRYIFFPFWGKLLWVPGFPRTEPASSSRFLGTGSSIEFRRMRNPIPNR